MHATTFSQNFLFGPNPGGIPPGAAGDPIRSAVEGFILAFDSNLKPIVGQQVTPGRSPTSGALARAIAMRTACSTATTRSVRLQPESWHEPSRHHRVTDLLSIGGAMAEPNISSPGGTAPRPTSTGGATTSPSAPRHNGGGIVDRVKESATAQLSTQKDRGIDAIGSVTQAVRSSTQKLRDEKHDTIAGYVDKAADQIENWSRQLRNKDAGELLTDVQNFARRQPAVFIGSAFALGIVAARFLKSSGSNEYEYGSSSRRPQYGGGNRTSTAYDRAGSGVTMGRDVTSVASEVAIPDVPGSTPASRNRRPATRSEKS